MDIKVITNEPTNDNNNNNDMNKKQMEDFFKDEFEKRKDEFETKILDILKENHENEDEKSSNKSQNSENSLTEIKRLRKKILTEYVYPDNEENIKTLLEDRKNFAILLQVIRSIRVFMSTIVITTILLSDTQFPNNKLSYIATIFSCVVSGLEIADRIIVQVNKKRSEKINVILKSIGIEYQMPETTLDDPTNMTSYDNRESSKRQSVFANAVSGGNGLSKIKV